LDYIVENMKDQNKDWIILRIAPERIKRSYLHEKSYYEIKITTEDLKPLISNLLKTQREEIEYKLKIPCLKFHSFKTEIYHEPCWFDETIAKIKDL